MTRHLTTIAWLALLATTAPAQKVAEIVLMEEDFGDITTRLGISTMVKEINTEWMARRADKTAALGDLLIEKNPRDYRGHALKYLALIELGRDRKNARQVAMRATAALQGKPWALGQFITKALYAAPTVDDYQLALMCLVPLVADHRNDATIRVAHLRALMGCGKIKEAVITNKDIVKDIGDDQQGLLLLAATICDMKDARSLAVVANKAISRVLALTQGSQSESHQRIKYRILMLLGRRKAAAEVGRLLVQRAKKSGLSLNNWVWYLMTKRESAGKFPGLAMLGAEAMMQASSHSNYELDTIALALFRAGRLEEAVDYQERAVKAGGDSGYQKRLEMYREALKAGGAKRPAAKDRAR